MSLRHDSLHLQPKSCRILIRRGKDVEKSFCVCFGDGGYGDGAGGFHAGGSSCL